jgi:hypothetical protein
MSNRSLQDTTLWSLICDISNTTFESLQEFLTDSRSDEDISLVRTIVDKLGIDPVHGVNEKWFIQMFLVVYRHQDLTIDPSTDIYKRASEWITFIQTGEIDTDAFLKKTVTLKIIYDNWRKRDMQEQIQVLVELYMYYQEVLFEFEYFTRMREEEKEESKQEQDPEEEESILNQISVWRSFYTDFASTILELIKLFAPKTYVSWIQGMTKQKQDQLQNNPELLHRMSESIRKKLKWTFWKEREHRYLGSKSNPDELVQWREGIINEWNQISIYSIPDSQIRCDISVTDSDEVMLHALVDCCTSVDKPAMRELYRYVITQYETGSYTLIESLSILFQRWWILCSAKEDEN